MSVRPAAAVRRAAGSGARFARDAAQRRDFIAAKEKTPGDDLLSSLVVRYQEAGEYDRERVISTAQILLNAGRETTASMIGLGILVLLENPDQLALPREDNSLIPGAVDELMRYLTVADMALFRIATEDIEIGGTVIRAGESAPSAVPNPKICRARA